MMKSKFVVEITVGLFVTLALVGLVVGVVWGKQIRLFGDRQVYTVLFDQVAGLEEGAPVVIRGIPAGEVRSIRLHEDRVVLDIRIQKRIPVYSDFTARIEMKDLMGGKQVVVDPGRRGVPADPNRLYAGDVQPDIVTIIHRAAFTLARLDSLVQQGTRILQASDIPALVAQMRSLSKEGAGMIRETRKPLEHSLVALESTLNQLNSDSTFFRMNGLIAQADSAAQSLHRVVRHVDSRRGTLGQLIHDKALYADAVRTTNRLDSLISDIQKHPKKYINVSVF